MYKNSKKVNDPLAPAFTHLDKIICETEEDGVTYIALKWHYETVVTWANKEKFIKMYPNADHFIKLWEKTSSLLRKD